MSLLCLVTAIIFMSMTGIGPVISIAVIVLPILMSLGIAAPVALFAFMGSIMAGIFANIVNFKQYQTIYAGFNSAAENYTYNDYFQIGMIGMVVSLVIVLLVANISMNPKKRYAMAAELPLRRWRGAYDFLVGSRYTCVRSGGVRNPDHSWFYVGWDLGVAIYRKLRGDTRRSVGNSLNYLQMEQQMWHQWLAF